MGGSGTSCRLVDEQMLYKKAVSGKTPYEAAFGKKPDLSDVREWGDKVWVWIEGGDKLGGRVREGRWMGVSDESKGVRVYWPDKKTISTERNVYFDKTSSSVSRLKGEEWELTETKPENAPSYLPQNIRPLPKSSLKFSLRMMNPCLSWKSLKSLSNESVNQL